MKKFMNSRETMLRESLAGFALCHQDIVALDRDFRFVSRRRVKRGKVALISGGGSGHEPLHAGFVGHGMLDAACPGQIFTSPTPDQMVAAAEAVETGAGILFIVKNYAGDVMNFTLAAEMCSTRADTLVIDDDVAVERSAQGGRRGVAGTVIVEKVVGAAAEAGAEIGALKRLGASVNDATRSMGVALTSCTAPAVGKPTFDIAGDEMEVGVGIHGEPGRRRVAMMRADEIAEELVDAIVQDLDLRSGCEVLLMINGLGGTPSLELHLMYDAASRQLAKRGLKASRSIVGNYVTSLDMAGCSITVTVLNDELTSLWDAPVHTPALRWRM
jgi:phosphoenolpyruvate---glycerone phosphotransferase subunit DhaK